MQLPSGFRRLEDLRAAGFVGFLSAKKLRADLSVLPNEPGVYMVVRTSRSKPRYARRSCAGHFKGRDPTVSVAILARKWIKGSAVIYIGKAGGGKSAATLRSRLSAYVRFGAGERVGHWGGRYIWQLVDANTCLQFCWGTARECDAAECERKLLRTFRARFDDRRPFANLLG